MACGMQFDCLQRKCFTRVLQGVIAVDSAIFPKGTSGNLVYTSRENGILGSQLDLLARLALWRVGLDYRHGTGHGVGAFLNVHEGTVKVCSSNHLRAARNLSK